VQLDGKVAFMMGTSQNSGGGIGGGMADEGAKVVCKEGLMERIREFLGRDDNAWGAMAMLTSFGHKE